MGLLVFLLLVTIAGYYYAGAALGVPLGAILFIIIVVRWLVPHGRGD